MRPETTSGGSSGGSDGAAAARLAGVRRWIAPRGAQLRTHFLISAVFVLLFASFTFSLGRYWEGTLRPRLYLAAETQAKILAQSQAASLVETLDHSRREDLAQAVFDLMQEMLIVEDPAIGGRIVLGVALQIDYDAVGVPRGALDHREGAIDCRHCFRASIPLIGDGGLLLGVADFAISEAYFEALSSEMKSKLYAESSVALVLLAAVWLAMLVMFHRLHAAKRAIEASDRAKTRFMANVTHELRTPLNAILGYTQLYKQDPALMARHGQGIQSIDRSAEHLLLMINDILDFSRMDEENLLLHPREVALAGFLSTLVEMTEVRARLKGIRLESRFSDGLPATISVDDKRLRQVLLNLLGNAVKFTERGTVTFAVDPAGPRRGDSMRLRFAVSDTGIGIGRAELANIFIPFHQLDNPVTRAEGSGLGLSISQRLVRLMGARLMVDSTPGVGSRFWFELDVPVLAKGSVAEFEAPVLAARPAADRCLPEAEFLDALQAHARRHNVLGVRALLQELAERPGYEGFLAQAEPLVRNYRFRQLAEWLSELRGA